MRRSDAQAGPGKAAGAEHPDLLTMCPRCEEFDVEVDVHGLAQLRRIMEKAHLALQAGKLRYNSFESDRALIGQTSFETLAFDGPLPDVIRYYFECAACGAVFSLMVETYHGQGGKWKQERKGDQG
jgi:hypothetical protein